VKATPKHPFNIGRGLFRIWAVLSLLWVLGAGAVYRPERFICQFEPLFACILHLYEATMLNTIPVDLPEGNGGLRWDALTRIQQTLVDSWFRAEQNAIDTDLENLRHNNYEPKADFYRNLARKLQIYNPQDLQYKLVRMVDLAPAEAAWLRHTWLEPSESRLAEAIKEFGVIGLGIPLGAGFVCFLALRVGRWVWAGFIGAG